MDNVLTGDFSEEHRVALFEVVEDLLKTSNFKLRTQAGSKKGDNFLGIVHRIVYSTADEMKGSKLIFKLAPGDETRRETFHARECFLREIYIYEVILPCFKEFEASKNISTYDGFHEYPRCYKTLEDPPNECLFLQDLNESHFSMIDMSHITVEHILLVMKTIGKFHATSFALKDQQPDKFMELVNVLHEPMFKHGYNFQKLPTGFTNSAMNAIASITDENDAHLLAALLKMYEKTQYETLLECVDSNAAEPYTTILHGDLWSNNTLFKMGSDENSPEIAYLIDWQLSRYASPALDLAYYIFICTSTEIRRRSYDTYLKTYHESLTNQLIRLGSSPDVFPYSALEDQLKKFGKYALAFATFLIPLFFSGSEIDIFTENLQNETAGMSEECKQRLRDIVADMYHLGYI